MAAISIPSPSAFLSSPRLDPLAGPTPSRKGLSRPAADERTSSEETVKADASTKPKQSKSRNGCITCKAKRLKCDEIKPSCQQCHKRNVQCGGYKKDFKWRPFEEASFAKQTTPTKHKQAPFKGPLQSAKRPSQSPEKSDAVPSTQSDVADASVTTDPSTTDQLPFHDLQLTPKLHFHADLVSPHRDDPLPFDFLSSDPSKLMPTFDTTRTAAKCETGDGEDGIAQHLGRADAFQASTGQSPRLIDLLLPSIDFQSPAPFFDLQTTEPERSSQHPSQPTDVLESFEEIEEIDRQQDTDAEAWFMRFPSPSFSDSSTSSTSSNRNPFNSLVRPPDFAPSSAEMLMRRFDQQTCGILSVKDGPTENPWRTLIWPLARESLALYHAIASMTAFHTCKQEASLRVEGMDHMRQSIHALASGIGGMATETALATTLVLAFSESWDVHIRTGIQHLKGAKILVNQALTQQALGLVSAQSMPRLRFLVNTWVYMDVIARLTSVDNDESEGFNNVVALYGPFGDTAEVDPLLGCASTLFPLIGRVANLVRRVWRSETNSPAIISTATELKTLIEGWQPGTYFEPPEDPTSEVKHSLQTAEAYRWATLLYLHQAVPEVPSLSSALLAKKVLQYLATVPLSSRTLVVQIYPLLAAGCEVIGQEDRQWVRERWAAMVQRMWIGNLDRCWEVIKEVWYRRDRHERQTSPRQRDAPGMPCGNPAKHVGSKRKSFAEDTHHADRLVFRSSDGPSQTFNGCSKRRALRGDLGMNGQHRDHRKSVAENITEDLDYEKTVRGGSHWVGVMKDWNWEVLLG